jgi:hypothetical protein
MSEVQREKSNRRKRIVFVLVGAIFVLALADYWFYPLLAVGGRTDNIGSNGLWLRYTWYFGQHRPDEVHALTAKLKHEQIRDAYFHVRYTQSDGRLHFHYGKEAKRLTAAVHADDPSVRVIAWVYVGNQHGLGGVNLEETEVRTRLNKEAKWLVQDCGFDGIQWDYEICDDNDQGFLRLLDESRAILGSKPIISVTAPGWMPAPFTGFGWSKSYFGEVAKRSGQIAIMAYDTGTYFPRAYTWLVGKQVTEVAPFIHRANPQCEVIIGLPTYEDGTPSHNPHAENISLGLKGVRAGLASSDEARISVQGVALFADYTTDEREWKIWDDEWIQH